MNHLCHDYSLWGFLPPPFFFFFSFAPLQWFTVGSMQENIFLFFFFLSLPFFNPGRIIARRGGGSKNGGNWTSNIRLTRSYTSLATLCHSTGSTFRSSLPYHMPDRLSQLFMEWNKMDEVRENLYRIYIK